jgi:hypothetical protein
MADIALIEYEALPGITVALHLGGGASALSDREILERHHRRVAQLVELLVDASVVDWDDARTRWLSLEELSGVLAEHGAGVCLIFLGD